ncbi:MAG: hypothetical protein ACLUD0_09180 [Eubacterium ramulus]
MKESVQIALTLVKSMFPEEAEILNQSDIQYPCAGRRCAKRWSICRNYHCDSVDIHAERKRNFTGVCHDR